MVIKINKKMLNTNVRMGLSIAMILILLAIIIFRKPEVITVSNDDKALKDSIALMQQQIDSSHVRQAKLEKAYDSLLNLEPKIKYRTNEKLKFIFNTASPSELDSIIRTNWKTSSRYN